MSRFRNPFKCDPKEVRDMIITRKLLPGKHGCVKESNHYGGKLVAVRYRKDNKGGYAKTVEIVVKCRRCY